MCCVVLCCAVQETKFLVSTSQKLTRSSHMGVKCREFQGEMFFEEYSESHAKVWVEVTARRTKFYLTVHEFELLGGYKSRKWKASIHTQQGDREVGKMLPDAFF